MIAKPNTPGWLQPPTRWRLALFLVALISGRAAAQLPGSLAADRARVREILGDTAETRADKLATDWLPLLRAVPFLEQTRLIVIEPELRFVYNTGMAFSLNDGPLWAGRGDNVSVGGGAGFVHSAWGRRVRVVIAPTFVFSQNRPFPVLASTISGRSAYSSPFHGPDFPIDLPLRFGDDHVSRVDYGRSELSVTGNTVSVGITAANEVWGPAIRNPLVMSANAAGIPRVFVGMSRPRRTRIGLVSAKLIAGALTESLFFDLDRSNDVRSLSGALITLRPVVDTLLEFTIARTVYAPSPRSAAGVLGNAFDALVHWEYQVKDSAVRSDQVMSVAARWRIPAGGIEVYGEFARQDLPRRPTEMLIAPSHSGAFTVGAQWAQSQARASYLRVQTEFTNIEQSLVFDTRPPVDFYTSKGSPQGYTQRGQMVGASIGPGASSQFLALDWLATGWQLGALAGRIRWDNDAMYRITLPTLFKHDVTVFGGLRGAIRTAWGDVSSELIWGQRYNVQFRNAYADYNKLGTVDRRNVTVSLAVTPR